MAERLDKTAWKGWILIIKLTKLTISDYIIIILFVKQLKSKDKER